jgi:hypothetical protein
MFGLRITRVFRNRWNALIWSVGILLTAYCSVPSADEARPQTANQKQAETPSNPWADTP